MANDIELLRKLDRLLTSDNPTVMDALKQALVLSDVAAEESDDSELDNGPLVTMYEELRRVKIELQYMRAKDQQPLGGDYRWTNTTGYDPNHPWFGTGTGYTMTSTTGAIGAVGSIGDIFVNYPTGNNGMSGLVESALPSDPDHFVLTDPDTGASMSVKYK